MGRYPVPNSDSSSPSASPSAISSASSSTRMLSSLLSSRVAVLVCVLLLSICCSSSRVSAEELEPDLGELEDNLNRVVTFADNTGECYNATIDADMDGNRKIDSTEYVDLIQLLGPPGFLEEVNEFIELPFILKINFGTLACLCKQNGGGANCCTGDRAHIPNAGAAEGETPTLLQERYLFAVCSLTETAINRVISSQAPSLAPALAPSDAPSTEPSLAPSMAPSMTPSMAPSMTPSMTPSMAPSMTPSMVPTTPLPTRMPSAIPTSTPTNRPTVSPSGAPSPLASDGPTDAPSSGPTDARSDGPTDAPSSGPTDAPSSGPTEALSDGPTDAPSSGPTDAPSSGPTDAPSSGPTDAPSSGPTSFPTVSPTALHSSLPTTSHVPTTFPTVSPSMNPTPVPSVSPTLSLQPSAGPTDTPSASPTDAPSVSPTASPSMTPTVSPAPSGRPSDEPTNAPTFTPAPTVSAAPSTVPTATSSPSSAPSLSPSSAPSLPPSSAPSLTPSVVVVESLAPSAPTEPDQVARTTFLVGVREGLSAAVPRSLYVPDLILSMNDVAMDVSFQINEAANNETRTRRLLLRSTQQQQRQQQQQQSRRLQINVQFPTSIDGLIETICPNFVNTDDRCEDIFASVGIFCLDSDDETSCEEYSSSLESALETAVLEGQLADALAVVNPDSPVFILTGDNGPDGLQREITPSDEGLSAGAITGLVAVGVVGFLMLSILLVRRNRGGQEYYSKQGEGDLDEITAAAQNIPETELDGPDSSKLARSKRAKSSDAPSLKKASMASQSDDVDNDGQEPYLKISGGKDDSSNAGSSGWSSHGGMSSIDTSSADEELSSTFNAQEGTSLAALGAASHPSVFRARSSASEGEDDADRSNPDDIGMTYSDLDRAISKGDWAAVGVTAALLASSQSFDTKSVMSNESSTKTPLRSTIDAKRAAELDRLVEAGDWEGVVVAAAKYDQQGEGMSLASSSSNTLSSMDSSKRNTMGSIMQSFSSVLSRSTKGGSVGSQSQSSKGSKSRSIGGESSGSGAGRSAFTSHTGDSAGSGTGRSAITSHTGGTTISQAKKRAEIRDEVEALVRRVVPEEVDNIDEMMAQFQGREEELVETLRTMQERAVAQKARLAGQKQAKREAKQMVEDKAEPATLAAVPASDGEPVATDDSWINEIEQTPKETSVSSGLLGARRLSPPKEEEDPKEMERALRSAIDAADWGAVERTAGRISIVDDGDQASGPIARSQSDGGSSCTSTSGTDPTQELNALVDKGDWEGVVKAASKFNDSVSKDETETERRTRRERRLQEEQEALAQADIWEAIAEQTKSEDAQKDTGASDAADWAIARSLSALVKATEDGKLQDDVERLDAHAEDEDNGEEDEDDRESV